MFAALQFPPRYGTGICRERSVIRWNVVGTAGIPLLLLAPPGRLRGWAWQKPMPDGVPTGPAGGLQPELLRGEGWPSGGGDRLAAGPAGKSRPGHSLARTRREAGSGDARKAGPIWAPRAAGGAAQPRQPQQDRQNLRGEVASFELVFFHWRIAANTATSSCRGGNCREACTARRYAGAGRREQERIDPLFPARSSKARVGQFSGRAGSSQRWV